MRVLLTRPYLKSIDMIKHLEAVGCTVLSEPILQIIPIRYQKDVFKKTKALIVTSQHASSQIANSNIVNKNTPIYAVGHTTAACLIQAGFTNLHIADGNATDLLQLIQNKHKPTDGMITYFSGWHITQDLAHALAMNGYDAQRIVCYKAVQTPELTPLIKAKLKNHEIDCIVFMSSRTASHFCSLCVANGLTKSLKTITAVTMSEQIADVIQNFEWKDIHMAKHPSKEAIIDCISHLKNAK